jgi:hypothetical protein
MAIKDDSDNTSKNDMEEPLLPNIDENVIEY